MTGDHEKSIAAGMNDHVTKPIDPVQLFATLAKWISHREEIPKKLEDSTASTGAQVIKPSQPEQTFPDSLPEFDLGEGLERLMGNRDLYRKLLIDFASQYTLAADETRTALDTGDFAQAHQLVHAIKGIAGNLAAKKLHQQSMALEKLVKHATPGNPPPTEELSRSYDAFRETLNRAIDAAGSLVASETVAAIPAETTLGSLPSEQVREAATRLREAAEIGDVSELTAICSELTAKSEAFAPYAIKVTGLAEEFDFDGILKLVDEMNK
jgi:HPt (histidine-containing phosphotransfer) domain-containing protein